MPPINHITKPFFPQHTSPTLHPPYTSSSTPYTHNASPPTRTPPATSTEPTTSAAQATTLSGKAPARMPSRVYYISAIPATTRQGGDNELHQHNLHQTQTRLLLRHIAQIPQQILKEQLIHGFRNAIRMRPEIQHRILLSIGVRPERMRLPGYNLMHTLLARACFLLNIPPNRGAYHAARDVEALGLVEVQMQRWGLGMRFPLGLGWADVSCAHEDARVRYEWTGAFVGVARVTYVACSDSGGCRNSSMKELLKSDHGPDTVFAASISVLSMFAIVLNRPLREEPADEIGETNPQSAKCQKFKVQQFRYKSCPCTFRCSWPPTLSR